MSEDLEREGAVEDLEPVKVQLGQIIDFVSGTLVRGNPEEIEAVQVFSHRLVEDYGYPKSHIQTRPQFQVGRSPSDEKGSYPIDIAVFKSEQKDSNNLFMIVECKKKTRKDGLSQLKTYLRLSPAEIGVWFNGNEHIYLRKVHNADGTISYHDLPNIPRANQRIEDIGRFKRKDLVRPSNLKAVFRDLRNHLAPMARGVTRDEAIAEEIINILFCKIYDEINTNLDDMVAFRSGIGEDAQVVKDRIVAHFNDKVKAEYFDVFSAEDTITLDADSLNYVVGELQNYCITAADRDVIGDAFEVFIGPALRGAEGQFFTPRNVVKMMIEMLDPQPGEMIIDPACGSGGFLISALEHVWKKIDQEAEKKGWDRAYTEVRKRQIATRCFRGIDKDSFLAKVTKSYMAIVGDGRGGIFCDNSLLPPDEWGHNTQDRVKLAGFDVVLTNPPFGAKIKVKGESILSQYQLGFKWKKSKGEKDFDRTPKLHDDQPPQLLFLERCLQLLKPGGRLGIVLPESILGNPSYEHIITFILKSAKILGVATMPESLFKTSGKGGTHTKVAVVLLEKTQGETPYRVFMADAKWCGHDSRGNPTIRKINGKDVVLDEVPEIAERYGTLPNLNPASQDHRGFWTNLDEIKNRILVPKYYDPELDRDIKLLETTHRLVKVQSLVSDGAIHIDTGVEVGKMAYGTGAVPFIRTSDLSNWEIKADFKHGVSKDIYEAFKSEIEVKPGDILLVRDGTYLIGTSAVVTEYDLPMLFQSHMFRIRVLISDVIDPWLLFACLNTAIVKRQIRSKQFTQDIIDTIGKRLYEIVLPIPVDGEFCRQIASETKAVIDTRSQMRNRARQLTLKLQGLPQDVPDEDQEPI